MEKLWHFWNCRHQQLIFNSDPLHEITCSMQRDGGEIPHPKLWAQESTSFPLTEDHFRTFPW